MIGQAATPAHGQSKLNRLMPERGIALGRSPLAEAPAQV